MAPHAQNFALVERDTSNEWYGRGVNLAIISITMSAMATILVITRLISRFDFNRKKIKGIGTDDVAIVGSLLCALGLTIANCISTDNGIGKEEKELDQHHRFVALKTFWVAQTMYKLTINLTKTSICLLYLRIFGHAKIFRRTVYCVMAFVLSYAVASIVATLIECTPLSRIWNKKIPGTCINLTAFWYSNAAANITGDVIIFLLPMRQIAALQMPFNQKVGIRLIFLLGLFVCVTSILRLTALNAGSKNKDQTSGTLNSTIWSTIEANTGIICACLPMLKSPLARLLPRYFPQGSHESAGSTVQPSRSTPPRKYCAPPSTTSWITKCFSRGPPPIVRNYPRWDNHGMPIRLVPQSPLVMPGSKISTTYPADCSSNKFSSGSSYETDRIALPKNVITKTTSVDVQYANDRRFAASLPTVLSPNTKEHNRSTSNLVGLEYANVSLD